MPLFREDRTEDRVGDKARSGTDMGEPGNRI